MSTRDDLLKVLEGNRDSFVSGSDIADELGVSGTAVWKAVNALRKEGYVIESVTNRGYRLSPDSDVLSYQVLSEKLADKTRDGRIRLEVFDSIDSTNNVCRDKAALGEKDGFVAVAANQTQGRGRRGRSFYSPDNTGLYMSILLRPSGFDARQALRFTTMAAVAVSEAIEEISGKPAGIKWVNDIYMNGLKVCGILTEASFDLESGNLDYAVVGIGINVFEPEGGFPEDIRNIAGAVFTGDDSQGANARASLAAEIIRRFFGYYEGRSSGSADYINKYRARCIVIGRDITVLSAGASPASAHALDIDDECGLIVRYEDGRTETLRSGEISIRF
ncbi:MAG: biotin--[Mogibacterium sp.]|nr:biotin--[acetyl-CoA-carboxylase] ligase [Mogibacterium sp.]